MPQFVFFPLCVLTTLIIYVAYRTFRSAVVKCIIPTLPGPARASCVKGNLGQIYNPFGFDFHLSLPERYGPAVKTNGILGDEHIYVTDPKALHQVVVKDQRVFEETSMFVIGNRVIFGPGLLSTLGEVHRRQRKVLNPVFSIAHMRGLVPTFCDVTRQLAHLLSLKLAEGEGAARGKTIDMLDFVSRTALELIGRTGIGYSFNALDEDTEKIDVWGRAMRNLIPTIFSLQIERQLLPTIVKLFPIWLRRLMVDLSPKKTIRDLRDMSDVIYNTSSRIIEEKKEVLSYADKGGWPKDIMSVLLNANSVASDEDRLSDEEVKASLSTFIFASTDTTSSALCRILHILAEHPEAQQQLREEIVQARDEHEKSHGVGKRDLNYDELVRLPYLDAIIRETLRLHPPVVFLSRTCRRPTTLEFSRPVMLTDGIQTTRIPVAENQNIIIGIATSNRDTSIWGHDANEWKPERWLTYDTSVAEELTTKVPQKAAEAKLPGIYSGMMTFLGGGRACIGFKYSQLELKAVLSLLLEGFKFSLPDDGSGIIWRVGNVQNPTTKGHESDPPSLPLHVCPL